VTARSKPRDTRVMNASGDCHSIDEILAAARARLDRVAPEDLEREQLAGAVIVDIRPIEQRTRDGLSQAPSSSTATSWNGDSIPLVNITSPISPTTTRAS
jgi:hypothetical protein